MTVDILQSTRLDPVTDIPYPDMGGAAQTDITEPGLDLKEEAKKPVAEVLEESQIQKTFVDSVVLVTGGTGFLGKLLVEKLLRSCPQLKCIYLLARPKKNKDIAKRLQEQFDDVLYDKLRKEQPDFLGKIRFVEGDVGHPELGLSAADRATLIAEVEVVFHGAATVRFDEQLSSAVRINVRGTRDLLRLARACPKLKAFVHISTAYSNCPLREIEERFYPSRLPGDKLIELVDSVQEHLVDSITPGLLGDFPNTYAFTKSAAEDIVLNHSRGLPVVMFRPSIVIGTAEEPVSGWIDNVYGPTGVVVGAAVGLIHTLRCRPGARADLVPGDLVAAALVAAAWRAHSLPGSSSSNGNSQLPPSDPPPPVYNFVCPQSNPLSWAEFMKYNEVYGLKVASVQAIYCYLLYLTPSPLLYQMYCFLLHWLPAYIVDGIAMLVGKKPMLRNAYRKISKFSDVMAYFATRQWDFKNDNTRRLVAQLNRTDRELFKFDMDQLNWDEYFQRYIVGIRQYLLKDPMDTVPRGLTRQRRLRVLHYFLLVVLSLLLLRLLWFFFDCLF